MRQDERSSFFVALRPAREAAYPQGEYVGQESFMRAGEIRELARRCGIGPGVSVLDLCCGVAGPGRLLMAELGCGYLGVDSSVSALQIAREEAGDLPGRFEQVHLPPLPDARFDVVFLLETLLAFPDKRTLLAEVVRALQPSGLFAVTVEGGRPLTPRERADLPDADTVWLVELDELTALLAEAGLTVTWIEDCTASHLATATALLQAFHARSAGIADRIGTRATVELITAHQLWCDWLGGGRVRKFALVAENRPDGTR